MNTKKCLVCFCLPLLIATANGREEYVLLPAPQQIDYDQGVCELAPDSFLWIDTSGGADLLRIADDIRDGLRGMYGELKLAASSRGALITTDMTMRIAVTTSKATNSIASKWGHTFTLSVGSALTC